LCAHKQTLCQVIILLVSFEEKKMK